MTPLIPFWRLEGDAYANQDVVRLVPDRQSKRGGMWNSQANHFMNWEVTFSILIHGVSGLGADGMAFWYTKETSNLNGGFFGFGDQFTGLGIVIDTYDNDNTGLHPLLVAIVNDGTKKYTHQHHPEGEGGSVTNMEVGNCQMHVRNLGGTSFVRITYKNKQLKVEHQLFGQDQWAQCLTANNINLPPNYHFGFTAATGHLADNHDVYGFSIRNLDMNAATLDSQRLYSAYDKYQIAEYLSKIQYEISTLKSNSGSAPALPSAPHSDNAPGDTGHQFEAVMATLSRLEIVIRDMAADVKSMDQKPVNPAVNSNLLLEISSLKTMLSTIQSRLSTTNANSPLPEQPPISSRGVPPVFPQKSSTSWWTIAFYILLGFICLGLLYVAVLFLRARNEREKKYF